MKTAIKILCFVLLFSVAQGFCAGEKTGRLAVLSIENIAKAHQTFVSSIPTMIVTELVQRSGEQLVERSKIEEAMKELGLENNGVTTDGSVKIGQWVGADRILLGSFSELEGSYRLDLRIIEVASGRILAASMATVRNDMSQLVPEAVHNLSSFLAPRYGEPENGVVINQVSPQVVSIPAKDAGYLLIRHRIQLSLFTEKSIPFQRVSVYVDRKLVAVSPVVKSVNDYYTIFDGKLEAGYHTIQLEHGVVDKNGEWKRLLEEQPKELNVNMQAGKKQNVEYRMYVESARFRFLDYERR